MAMFMVKPWYKKSAQTIEYWAEKSFSGLVDDVLDGTNLWSDGQHTYYSNGTTQYEWDYGHNKWKPKVWNGLAEKIIGKYIWTDGDYIYCNTSYTGRYVLDKYTNTWSQKTWYFDGVTSSNFTSGNYIWTDGTDIYYSNGSNKQFVLNKSTSTWSTKTWTGLSTMLGTQIWTDGTYIYYSNGGNTSQYVLDKSTSTWSKKTWTGLTNFYGNRTWTDGANIYYSNGSSTSQYILDKTNSTWSKITVSGYTSADGLYVFHDPVSTNIYYCNGIDAQYIWNNSNYTWVTRNWTFSPSFLGKYIWSDGTDYYYSNGTVQYVYDKANSEWTQATWSVLGGTADFSAFDIWTDGNSIYYSNGTTQYELDTNARFTWKTKTWSNLSGFLGRNIWTDGTNIYQSSSSNHYVLNTSNSSWSTKTWTGLSSFDGADVWTDGTDIYVKTASDYVLNKNTSTWSRKSFSMQISFNALPDYIWYDGGKVYFSRRYYPDNYTIYNIQQQLNIPSSAWSDKTWTGTDMLVGEDIWSDGTEIYCSYGTSQYMLVKETA